MSSPEAEGSSPGAVRPAVPAVIVTHGGLGEALVRAAEAIVGPIDGLQVLSNTGLSRDTLAGAVAERVRGWGPEGGLVLVDLLGGSCAQAALLGAARAARGPVPVLCGVNLPMLLDYVHNRDRVRTGELAERLVARGRSAVTRLEQPD